MCFETKPKISTRPPPMSPTTHVNRDDSGCEKGQVGELLFHFSEDPTIEWFAPHVPATNQRHPPAVWAIDESHAPLYWFPRACPRLTAWPWNDEERLPFRTAFATAADGVHAIELAWLQRVQTTVL